MDSTSRRVTSMSDRDNGTDEAAAALAFLATVPLLDGMSEAELAELAYILRHRQLPAGEVLWNEGDNAAAMVLIVEGRVSVSLRLPGGRAVEVTTLGRGE